MQTNLSRRVAITMAGSGLAAATLPTKARGSTPTMGANDIRLAALLERLEDRFAALEAANSDAGRDAIRPQCRAVLEEMAAIEPDSRHGLACQAQAVEVDRAYYADLPLDEAAHTPAIATMIERILQAARGGDVEPVAGAQLGANDRRIAEASAEIADCQATLDALDHTGQAPEEEDAIRGPYLDRIIALREEIIATKPDTVRGAAMKAKVVYNRVDGAAGNELGTQPPARDAGIAAHAAWSLLQDLQSLAARGA